MTDLEIGPSALPRTAGFVAAAASTPLRRAVGRLQDALPSGWQVEIIGAPGRQPVVRVVTQGA
ncbi:hypothetical protein ACW2Q0_01925 [Nocardia sp. R16R-3T]